MAEYEGFSYLSCELLCDLRALCGQKISPQIRVSLIDPVGARWIKNIKVDRILERLGPVWHVGRNGQDLARTHHNLFAIDPEFQRALQDVGDLLIMVAMF